MGMELCGQCASCSSLIFATIEQNSSMRRAIGESRNGCSDVCDHQAINTVMRGHSPRQNRATSRFCRAILHGGFGPAAFKNLRFHGNIMKCNPGAAGARDKRAPGAIIISDGCEILNFRKMHAERLSSTTSRPLSKNRLQESYGSFDSALP